MKKKKVIFLINPISGTGGRSNLQQTIERWATKNIVGFEIHPTSPTGNYDNLIPKIYNEHFTTVAVCGGDGSVNAAVEALAHTGVQFGIIPMGSGNGLAFAAGIPKNRKLALDILLTGTPKRTDAFRMNGLFACMLCGVGFDAQIAHEFAQQSTRGLLTYASLTAGHFLKATPYPFEIEANGQAFQTEAFFISIANSNQFGNYVTIAPKASLSDGMLDIVVVKKMAKPTLLFHLIKQVLTGKPIKPERTLQEPVIYFQTQQVKIKNLADAPIHIDGEPRPSCKELNIEIQRDFFTLIHAS